MEFVRVLPIGGQSYPVGAIRGHLTLPLFCLHFPGHFCVSLRCLSRPLFEDGFSVFSSLAHP